MYVKGYAIDWDKIKAFLEITDNMDGRIDGAMIQIMGYARRETNPIAMGRRIGAPLKHEDLVISFGLEACGSDLDVLRKKDIPPPPYLKKIAEPLLSGPDVFELVEWSCSPCQFDGPKYVKGYVMDWNKIKAFLEITDDTDGRIDDAMIQIMGYVKRETNPIATGRRIGPLKHEDLVISFGPEACGSDLDELRKKDIPPPPYLKKIAEPLLSGPDVFEFMEWACCAYQFCVPKL